MKFLKIFFLNTNFLFESIYDNVIKIQKAFEEKLMQIMLDVNYLERKE